jgi:hypothetical protein
MTLSEVKAMGLIRHPYEGTLYCGLGYERASRLGRQLCRAAAETGCFKHLPGHLAPLIVEMEVGRWLLSPSACRHASPR